MTKHRRCSNDREVFEAKTEPEPNTGCWLWTGKMFRNGYGCVSSGPKGNERYLLAHRVSRELFHGDRPDVVMHSCDNRACVNPAHLRAGTQMDNVKDCMAKGRKTAPPRLDGSLRHNAKLTESDISEIARMRREGMSQRLVGEAFGVKQALISKIERGLAWKHVPQDWL
jgi:hypothetical protein